MQAIVFRRLSGDVGSLHAVTTSQNHKANSSYLLRFLAPVGSRFRVDALQNKQSRTLACLGGGLACVVPVEFTRKRR